MLVALRLGKIEIRSHNIDVARWNTNRGIICLNLIPVIQHSKASRVSRVQRICLLLQKRWNLCYNRITASIDWNKGKRLNQERSGNRCFKHCFGNKRSTIMTTVMWTGACVVWGGCDGFVAEFVHNMRSLTI